MRSSKVEICMLCDSVPCECHAKPKTIKTPRSKTEPKPVVEVKSSGAQAAIAKQLSKQNQERFTKRFLTPQNHRTKQTVDTGDATLVSALKNLEHIMAPEDREKYRVLLTSELSLDQRAATWRARRGHND